MIVQLLRRIEAHLAEIVKILRQPEDFSKEDESVLRSTKEVLEATERLPHPEQTK